MPSPGRLHVLARFHSSSRWKVHDEHVSLVTVRATSLINNIDHNRETLSWSRVRSLHTGFPFRTPSAEAISADADQPLICNNLLDSSSGQF